MSSTAEPVGTIEVALAHASRLLQARPELALAQTAEILKVVPAHPQARLLRGRAFRATGNLESACEELRVLTGEQPNWPAAHYELGVALGIAGQADAAVASLRQAVHLQADMPDAWRALADQLTVLGDLAGADAAYAQHIKASTRDPRLLSAAAALCENDIPRAEALLRDHLRRYPTDVAAIRMFAEVAARLRRYTDAENLLARCLELAPSFHAARHHYAIVLHRQNKPAQALREIEALLALEPTNPTYNNLKAAILARIGEFDQSIEIYAELLAAHPAQPKIWLSYGHALKTNGREQDSVAAYRHSIELQPGLGEAFWSLANLKTTRFSERDIIAMREQLERADLAPEDRFHLHFAMGKALEDAGAFEESFAYYAAGNRLRREGITYDPEEMSSHVRRSKKLLSREFFAARRGHGAAAADPIFIVGLPRAGSTLLEQILASHSQVEGTMELPDIPAIAKSLIRRGSDVRYPEVLGELRAGECRALGEQYLEQTRIQRKTDAPFFIDKMPNNFAHVGLIHLILPEARIIDARRHPLGCCFSGFKQHFARGQHFSYDLQDMGRYYHDYVELMAHFDAMLPGRVHRVLYESMIDDTEGEVRRLLTHCGLPFEEQCLRFYENDRAVRTASSQQVRQPIFRAGVDQWRHYENWLGPMKAALGPVIESYPGVPEF